jgi:hypothetical protein
LKFDFSPVNRSSNIIEENELLKDTIALSFKSFYTTYSTYLGKDANELFKNIALRYPTRSLVKCVEWVQDVISKARKSGDKRLAGVEGVSNSLSTY